MPDRLKIALVANTTWNIYNFRLNLIKALVRRGYEVIVIAPVDEYIHYLNSLEGVTHLTLEGLYRKNLNPIEDFKLLLKLKRIYRAVKPDLVIHYTIKPNIYGSLAARWQRCKSIGVVTGLGYTFLHPGLIQHITKTLYRFAFRFTERVLFENGEDKQLFLDLGLVKSEQATHVAGCGVDVQYYAPRPRTYQGPRRVFTFIGRLLYDKGIVEFVAAAENIKKQFPDAEFWVIGEIDEGNPSFIKKNKLVEWIENKTIRYLGVTNHIRDYFEHTDCVVLPSYREGLSKVLLESLAMGKPIITTDTPGCRETVKHGENGFLVPTKDADALALAMETFLGMPHEEVKAMQSVSRTMALEKYNDQLVSEQYLEIIRSTLSLPVKDVVVDHDHT